MVLLKENYTYSPLEFCSIPVAIPLGASLHSFKGGSVHIGLMVWGTLKRGFQGFGPLCL